MAKNINQDLIDNLKRLSNKNIRNRSAEDDNDRWIKNKIKNLHKQRSSRVEIGNIYLSVYDAKYKDVLPVWDAVPMFLVVGFSKEGNAIGLNMHYLPPRLRVVLLSALLEIAGKRTTNVNKMKMTYQLLKVASINKFISPTIHSYIRNRFKSKIVRIPQTEWLQVAALPLASFQGKSNAQVYRESRNKIKG